MIARLLHLDATLLQGVRRWHHPRITRVMRALTHLGDAYTWIVLAIALIACGGAARAAGMRIAAAALGAALLTQILKRTCKRPRPSERLGGAFQALAENPDAFSFPSGHAAAAFGVAVALAGAGPLGPLALALAPSISVSRVYLGAHYPLDVIIGAALGTATGLLVHLVVFA